MGQLQTDQTVQNNCWEVWWLGLFLENTFNPLDLRELVRAGESSCSQAKPSQTPKTWENYVKLCKGNCDILQKKRNSNTISGNLLAFLPPRKSSATPVASICPAIHASRTWNSFTTPKCNLIRNTTQLKQCKCPGRLLHCIMPYLWNWVRLPCNFLESWAAKISNLLDIVPTRPCKCSCTCEALKTCQRNSKNVTRPGHQ